MALSGPINVSAGVSTLKGDIFSIEVWPDLPATEFERMILDDRHRQSGPSCVNEDVAVVTLNSAPTIRDDLHSDATLDRFYALRIFTWDGVMLQDDQTLGSQLDSIGTLYKLVWYKQQDTMSDDERLMVDEFAASTHRPEYSKRTRGFIVQQPAGTKFVVYPVWGTGDRRRHILGVFYQHWNTENHCKLMGRGVNPMMVDQCGPVQMVTMVVQRS